jgi:hypothetical protein
MAKAVVTGTGGMTGGGAPYLRWFRTVALAFSLVFAIYAVWSWATAHFWPGKSDFVSFWAAGRLALSGHPELAYDIAAHHAAEQAVGPVGGLLPFSYPPPFLALVTPFALLPFGAAFFAWVGATLLLYAWAARRVAPLAYAFAIPAGYINLLIGQNGFLFSGIFILGLTLVRSNPWIAGMVLGTLVMKPQIALVLPVAMLAGREWRVIGGAACSAAALLLLGLVLFGWSSYQGFFDILPQFVAFMREGRLTWDEMASPFALARSAGVPQQLALAIHGAIAAVAALVTARAWWLRLDTRVPILAAATLLAPPYLLTYDALLLVVPLGWMIRERRHPYSIAIAWLCALVPIVNYYTPFAGPNLTSVAAIICLATLAADARAKQTADKVSGAPAGALAS